MSINIAPSSSSSSDPPSFNNEATTTAASTTTTTNDYHVGAPALSNMIHQDLIFMKEAMEEVRKYVDHMNVQINQACEKFEELIKRGGRSERELGELKKVVKKLKSQIPPNLFKIHSADSKPRRRNPWFDGSINRSSNQQVIVNKSGNDNSTEFQQFKASFLGLPLSSRLCLFCFLRFPEMVTIKKKVMIYWWIGEGLVPPIAMDQKSENEIAVVKTAEDFGDDLLNNLMAMGFIEPVYTKCSLVADSCRISPFIRSALTILAESSGFSSIYTLGPDTPILAQYHEDRQCLLNVGAAIINGGPELFLDMKNCKIIYLGRWQSSATHHIEIADTKLLHGLKNMKQLRFLSLRGISLITELPQFISRLTNLKILDLKACHNLEVVPEGIGMLKSLTHLDMSECYLLDRMPKGLGSLTQLQVLKGFIIGDSEDKRSCTIHDLTKCPKLRKLSIYTYYTSMKEFPTINQLQGLQRLNTLQKLKICWSRGCPLQVETDTTLNRGLVLGLEYDTSRILFVTYPLELPSSLQKLELECYPGTTSNRLLIANVKNPENLKKLYIRGGLFWDLRSVVATNIKILRLKYLSELEMDWSEFRELFPNLIYLEKVECPGLTGFPCDENGVWMNRASTNN